MKFRGTEKQFKKKVVVEKTTWTDQLSIPVIPLCLMIPGPIKIILWYHDEELQNLGNTAFVPLLLWVSFHSALELIILLFTLFEVVRPLVHTVTKAHTNPISNCCW